MNVEYVYACVPPSCRPTRKPSAHVLFLLPTRRQREERSVREWKEAEGERSRRKKEKRMREWKRRRSRQEEVFERGIR